MWMLGHGSARCHPVVHSIQSWANAVTTPVLKGAIKLSSNACAIKPDLLLFKYLIINILTISLTCSATDVLPKQ